MFVKVAYLSTLAVKVRIPTEAKVIVTKVVSFNPIGVNEFIRLQGFSYQKQNIRRFDRWKRCKNWWIQSNLRISWRIDKRRSLRVAQVNNGSRLIYFKVTNGHSFIELSFLCINSIL